MFEPDDQGVTVHGEVAEVNVQEAEAKLQEIEAFASVTVEKHIVLQQNWNAQWESEYPQVVVEDEEGHVVCTIRAPFHKAPTSGLDVVVAPQMSFGTGHHATTYLMTRALMSLDLSRKAVLDMGCGTGVLALVAALQGAVKVLGIDIEHDAVQNAMDNANLNPGLRDSLGLHFEQGDGSACEEMKAQSWHLICANIHKNVLTADMPRYARTLRAGGDVLFSGFFEGDVPAMQTAVEAAGLEVFGVSLREGWACMHCGKPSA